jgi:NAD(P)-dependent dehydrogenase (short-subunit alcohol dehydrogenase family)
MNLANEQNSGSDVPKVWFITGSSSGFGAAIARAALARGDYVIATARNTWDLADLADHPNCRTFALDVSKSSEIPVVLAQAQGLWGRLDVIVNNAGVGLIGALEDSSDSEIANCMAVNFYGPLNVMRASAAILRTQRCGHVIQLSAAAAIANYAGFSIYGAAKAALESASESFLAELAPHGIKLTLVQPGPFRTSFIGRSLQATALQSAAYENTSGKFKAMLSKMDQRQPGDPDKAAAVIVQMVQSGQAPLRLVLGKYAAKKVRDTAAARLRDLEAWQEVAGATDFG